MFQEEDISSISIKETETVNLGHIEFQNHDNFKCIVWCLKPKNTCYKLDFVHAMIILCMTHNNIAINYFYLY
jgi:hypothetical protein